MGYPYHSEQGKQGKGRLQINILTKILSISIFRKDVNCGLNHSVTSLSIWQSWPRLYDRFPKSSTSNKW